MRLSLALLSVAFAASVTAQLPNCAAPCIANSTNYGGCASDDNNCLCHNQNFINLTTACIEQSCTGSDLTEAISFAQQLCAAVGVNLNTTSSSSSSASASSQTSAPDTASSSTTNTQGSGALSHSIRAAAGLAFVSSVVGLLL